MKRLMRLTALLLALSLCILPVHAAEPEDGTVYFTEWSEGLDEIMADYMEEHGLSEKNFSMGYLYTGTGEYWYYNEEKLMIGGSIYKLPLNMRVTEKVLAGELSWDDRVAGVLLPEAQHMSIAYSNNPISEAMQRYMVGRESGYYIDYRNEIAKYSGSFLESIPNGYYSGNVFSSEFMLNTILYLYNHQETFSDIIGYMTESTPGANFRLYEGDYTIAHKYGAKNAVLNDVGIIYTPTPFLLVVLTDGAANREEILGELCLLMTEYTLGLDAKYEAERQASIAEAAQLAEILAAEEAAAIAGSRESEQLRDLAADAEHFIADLADSLAFSALQFCFP